MGSIHASRIDRESAKPKRAGLLAAPSMGKEDPEEALKNARDQALKDLNWLSIGGSEDFLPVVRAAFDWVSHKRAMVHKDPTGSAALSYDEDEDESEVAARTRTAEQEAETRINVEAVMSVLEGLISERDREIESLCSSQYSELAAAVEALSHVRTGVDEVAAAVQDFSIHVKKEGEGLRASLASLRETEVLVRNVSGAKAAIGTALSALHLLAEAHNLCEDGRPYQALRAVDILRARYLQPIEEAEVHKAVSATEPQSPSALVATVGPLRAVLEREVRRIVEEVDKRSLAGFHEWLVTARKEARAVGSLAMQHELGSMDARDVLLLGQEALKALLAVGERPVDIGRRMAAAGLVDQPPEDAFLPTLGDGSDEEEEGMSSSARLFAAARGANAPLPAALFMGGSRVLGHLDLTPLHRTLEVQRRLGKESWFREYYLSNRRQQLMIDFKPSSESKQKEVAASFIHKPQDYMGPLVGFFVVERGVSVATRGSVTDQQEIKSLFNAMVPTLVELLGAALDKAAAEAAAEGGEDEDGIPLVVSAPQLLMVKSQIHVACEVLHRRGLDVAELVEVLWRYKKKFLGIILRDAERELRDKLFDSPPPPPPTINPKDKDKDRDPALETPPPLPRWLERHQINNKDMEDEEFVSLGLPRPWLLRDGLDEGARSVAQAFNRYGGGGGDKKGNQAVMSSFQRNTKDLSRFPYRAPYSDLVVECLRTVRQAVELSAAFFRGLAGRSDVTALVRDFFLRRILVQVVREPIKDFIKQPTTPILWALQLSADAHALLHSAPALEEAVTLAGKGVTSARTTQERSAMLSVRRTRALAAFQSKFVRQEEYSARAAAAEMQAMEGTASFGAPGLPPGAIQISPLTRPSMSMGSTSQLNINLANGQHGKLFRPSTAAFLSGGGLGRGPGMTPRALRGGAGPGEDEEDHSEAWRALIQLAGDVLSTAIERLVSLATVRIAKVAQSEKYWYEEVFTDRPPLKKDWRGNILPDQAPSPFNAPAPLQFDPTQPTFPEPNLLPQEIEAETRDYLKQCVELLPPEQCLQAHWRFFKGCSDALMAAWRHESVGKWSSFGVRRLHSDLTILEYMADRSQLEMITSGVFDALGIEARPTQSDADREEGVAPPPANPNQFDLKDAMGECRQLANLILSARLDQLLDHQLRPLYYGRIELMTCYYLLDKYSEPPGSTMVEIKAKLGGKARLFIQYPRRKDTEMVQKKLIEMVKETADKSRAQITELERLAMGITPANAPLSATLSFSDIPATPAGDPGPTRAGRDEDYGMGEGSGPGPAQGAPGMGTGGPRGMQDQGFGGPRGAGAGPGPDAAGGGREFAPQGGPRGGGAPAPPSDFDFDDDDFSALAQATSTAASGQSQKKARLGLRNPR